MLSNARGNAMIEIVPILAIFILLVNFSLGFFGLIHSGILNSIAARNYAFETFRNRADVRYLRDVKDSENTFTYAVSGLRFHVILNETRAGNDNVFFATRRPINFVEAVVGGIPVVTKGTPQDHNKILGIIEGKKVSDVGIDEGVDPVWVRTAYGICLTASCGGQ